MGNVSRPKFNTYLSGEDRVAECRECGWMVAAVRWTPKDCSNQACPTNEWKRELERPAPARQLLQVAHDELSRVLEDEDAGNDEVRDAAIGVCDALNAFWEDS